MKLPKEFVPTLCNSNLKAVIFHSSDHCLSHVMSPTTELLIVRHILVPRCEQPNADEFMLEPLAHRDAWYPGYA